MWADVTDADYVCSTDNQFTVRATGGVDFQTGAAALRVNGNTAWHAGNDGSGSTLDADLLDGQHGGAFQQKYGNVVVVAKSGGDYTSIQAALTDITGVSDTNRYLVWVAPGIYTETVTMKQYVDIEGAGELLTTISSGGAAGTVTGANNAELRFLTVRNTGGVSAAVAIFNNFASPWLTHVTATASGGTNSYGVYNAASSPTIQNSTVRASGGTNSYGIYNSASGGLHTVKVNNCQVTGSTNTIRNDTEFTVRIGASQLDGGAVTGGGTVTCAGIYDEAYTFYASTCPP